MNGHILRAHPISATEYKEVFSETAISKREIAIYLLSSYSNF